MPDQKWTVQAVKGSPREWTSGKGQAMKSYRIDLKNEGGVSVDFVELAQRDTTEPPKAGDVLEGEIQDRTYESGGETKKDKKFKKASRGGFGGGGGRPHDPAETAAIQRQHSQEMAIRAIDVATRNGVAVPDAAKESGKEFMTKLVKPLADWFDADIQDAVKAFKQRQKETSGGSQ